MVSQPQSTSASLWSHAIHLPSRLWHNRGLILQLTQREVGQRYRGSFLGILWSLITPLLLLAIYTFVFSVIFQSRWRSDAPAGVGEFALIMFAGLAAFNLFSEAANRAPHLILSIPNYVKKVVFPLEVWPIVIVASALINSLIIACLVIVGSAIFLGRVSPTLFLLPFAYVPLILITLGITWFLAALGVYVRDVGQGIGLLVQFLFFLSPVFYPPTAVPEQIRVIFDINPMTFVLGAFRQALLWGETFDWGLWAVWTLVGGVVALGGYLWFMQTKKGFADVM